MLAGKKILVGVTGGIAAYKIPHLVRNLVKKGAEVKVLLTKDATAFVSPLALSTVSKNSIFTDFVNADHSWNNHVELALWADLMVIAPATANTLAKMANGQSDNFLLTTWLSAKCPVFVAPAMDLDMYQHPAVKRNIAQIEKDGAHIIPATKGELASGLSGYGRMEEPDQITQILEDYFASSLLLNGKKILISAGPTFESIDPVRFIGNNSSGKMGFALAENFAKKGASVTLVAGPVSVSTQNTSIHRINVISAEEMHQAMLAEYESADIVIMAAAVADYRPKEKAEQKIKKSAENLTIELVKNPDILSDLGAKKKHQFLVGFALETNNEEENAKDKLKRKNLDAIVLNSLQNAGAGFQHDTNQITIIDKQNKLTQFELKDKRQVAEDIAQFVIKSIL